MVRIYCEFSTCKHNYRGRDVFGQDAGRPVRLCKCKTLSIMPAGKAKYPVCDSIELKGDKDAK